MSPSTINDNKEALAATADAQQQTKTSLTNIQRDLTHTQLQGTMTLEDLYAQRRRLEKVQDEGDRLHDKLDETETMQRKLGTWFGGLRRKKRFNRAEAEAIPAYATKENQPHANTTSKPTNQKNWKPFKKSSKKVDQEDAWPEIIAKRGLLGDNNIEGEHREDLLTLADEDKEIDDQLDAIGNQLGSLVRLSEQIGEQTHTQGHLLKNIDTRMEEVNQRQKKVNKKTKKLLR